MAGVGRSRFHARLHGTNPEDPRTDGTSFEAARHRHRYAQMSSSL